MINVEELRIKISKYIEDNELSQESFAKTAGVSAATVSGFLHGRRVPQERLLKKLDKAVSLKATEFVIDFDNLSTLSEAADVAKSRLDVVEARLEAIEKEKTNLEELKKKLTVLASLKDAQKVEVSNDSCKEQPKKEPKVEKQTLFDEGE